MKNIISTENAPAAIGPYSQAILMDNLLFVSGVMPINPKTNTLVESNIATQTEQVLKNIEAILSNVGLDEENVVKTTCFLSSMALFNEFNQVYEKYFIHKPARSCVAVKSLPKNALVEIEVIAHR